MALAAAAVLSLLGGCATGGGAGGPSGGRAMTHGRLDASEQVYVIGRPVDIEVSRGDVEIAVTDAVPEGRLRVAASLHAVGVRDSEADRRVHAAYVDANPDVNEVRVRFPGGTRGGDRADLNVHMPPVERLRVRTGDGRVRIYGTEGILDVGAESGSIRVVDHDGTAWVQGGSAPVSVERCRGRLIVRTGEGGVFVHVPEGATEPLDVYSESGPVMIVCDGELPAGSRAESGQGPIRRLTVAQWREELQQAELGEAFEGLLPAGSPGDDDEAAASGVLPLVQGLVVGLSVDRAALRSTDAGWTSGASGLE